MQLPGVTWIRFGDLARRRARDLFHVRIHAFDACAARPLSASAGHRELGWSTDGVIAESATRRRRGSRFFRRISLSQWIVISMVVGIVLGWAFPDAARSCMAGGRRRDLNVLSSVFLRMIKSLIVPLLFAHAGRRHRGPRRRHEARGPAGAPVDHLLRDRDDARARRRAHRGQHRQAGPRRRPRRGVGEGGRRATRRRTRR